MMEEIRLLKIYIVYSLFLSSLPEIFINKYFFNKRYLEDVPSSDLNDSLVENNIEQNVSFVFFNNF